MNALELRRLARWLDAAARGQSDEVWGAAERVARDLRNLAREYSPLAKQFLCDDLAALEAALASRCR